MTTDHKVLKEWIRLADHLPGWSATKTRRGRIKFSGPRGSYHAPSTPGGHRSMDNTRAALRRLGLPID